MTLNSKTTARPLAIFVLAGALAYCGSPDPAIRTVRIYDLLAALPRAVVDKPDVEWVAVADRTVIVGGQERRALFLHPRSVVTFPAVEVGDNAVLTCAIGVEDKAWDKDGDGVEFIVQVKLSTGAVVNVFSRYINPKANEAERHWIDLRIPLGGFAGQRIEIILATNPGPAGDTAFDWAVWADPRVVLDPM